MLCAGHTNMVAANEEVVREGVASPAGDASSASRRKPDGSAQLKIPDDASLQTPADVAGRNFGAFLSPL